MMLSAAVLWGFIGVLSKFLLVNSVSPTTIATLRVLIASVFFLFIVRKKISKEVRLFRFEDWIRIVIFALIGVVGLELTNVLSVQSAGPSYAAVLLYSAPMWVLLYQKILEKKPTPSSAWWATGLTTAGILGLLASAQFEDHIHWSGLAWGLTSGACFAFFFVMGQKMWLRFKNQTWFALSFVVAALLLSAFTPLTHLISDTTAFRWPSGVDWIYLFALSFFCTFLAYKLYSSAAQVLEPSECSVLAALEPFVASIASWFIWNESLTLGSYICGFFVIAAVTVVSVKTHSGTSL
jgi:DME family drug/metabolite transporter